MSTIKFYSVESGNTVEVEVSKVKKVLLKNGRPAAQAVDPESGVMMYKFLSAAEAALIPRSDENDDYK